MLREILRFILLLGLIYQGQAMEYVLDLDGSSEPKTKQPELPFNINEVIEYWSSKEKMDTSRAEINHLVGVFEDALKTTDPEGKLKPVIENALKDRKKHWNTYSKTTGPIYLQMHENLADKLWTPFGMFPLLIVYRFLENPKDIMQAVSNQFIKNMEKKLTRVTSFDRYLPQQGTYFKSNQSSVNQSFFQIEYEGKLKEKTSHFGFECADDNPSFQLWEVALILKA